MCVPVFYYKQDRIHLTAKINAVNIAICDLFAIRKAILSFYRKEDKANMKHFDSLYLLGGVKAWLSC
jgi:hypothetical protein